MIVAGSSLYKADDPQLAMALMKRSVERLGNGRGDAELSPLAVPRVNCKVLEAHAQLRMRRQI